MRKILTILTCTLLLISLTGIAFAENESLEINDSEDEEMVFCTQDVQLCEDGSYVGRDSSNDCEFYACPGEEDEEDDEDDDELEEELEDEDEIEEEDELEEELLGSSCGTVTPGMQNECCLNKGYEGWDEEEFKCIGERSREQSRERIKFGENNQVECPEGCVCSGQTVKCSFENGTRVMTVYAGNSGNVIVQVKNINASTNVTLYREDGKVYGTFRNNETKEIQLPDEVMEKLKEKKGKKLQLQNESIELTEEGYYKVEMKKKSRLFLIIPVKESVNAEVDAETGETIKLRNPWWGFLAKDIKDDVEEESED
jgi:hypothetical protein